MRRREREREGDGSENNGKLGIWWQKKRPWSESLLCIEHIQHQYNFSSSIFLETNMTSTVNHCSSTCNFSSGFAMYCFQSVMYQQLELHILLCSCYSITVIPCKLRFFSLFSINIYCHKTVYCTLFLVRVTNKRATGWICKGVWQICW